MDFWMVVCLFLVVAAGGVKFKTRVHIQVLRTELAAQKERRQKVASQHRIREQELEALQLAEKEWVLDCRDLTEALQALQERMKKIEDLMQQHGQRPEGKALEEETGDEQPRRADL